ncbi:MAG: DNA-binding protein [Acidobacteriota bacterium]
MILLIVAAALAWRPRESTWENPLEGAQFSRLTDFEGTETDASISADGKFVVFLSDRDGRFDAWVTQLGTGDFKNLTGGLVPDLGNPVIRNLGLTGDSSKVWLLINDGKGGIDDWTVPTMGGPVRPFLTSGVGAAWSTDGSRLVYHEYTAGDPIFVADRDGSNARRIFIDQPGYHDHYLTWSPDGRYIYFVRGIPATRETDVWRLAASGGDPERITSHHNWVVSPTLIDNRTLLYSSVADDGSGPWLYAMNVEQRVPHRVSLGVEQYTSVSATVDGRRLVATVNNPAGHLWTLPILDHPAAESDASEVQLPNVRAVSPRYALDGFLYLSSGRSGDGLWKLEKGGSNELWRGTENGEISSPAVSSDGRVSFTLRKQGRGTLHVMTANGTGVRTLAETLDVSGVPSWSPDGRWIVVTADQGQGPSLFKVPMDGGALVPLVNALASNPVWSPDGKLIVYTGPQISLGLPIKAVNPDGQSVPFPNLSLRIGGERHRFMPDGKGLVFVRGPWMKEAFYLLDLATGKERQLSDLKPGFTIRSFDVSPDGKQILFDRVRDNSDLVLIDLKVKP